MIIHLSISAHNPKHVASVLAELWKGEVLPFPPVPGGFVAIAGDERASIIEVYPETQGYAAGPEEYALVERAPAKEAEPVHFLMQIRVSEEDAIALGTREGWTVRKCSRGGMFDVIELWVENRQMVELVTPQMAQTYVTALLSPEFKEFCRSASWG